MGLQKKAQTLVLDFDHGHPRFAVGLDVGPSAVLEVARSKKEVVDIAGQLPKVPKKKSIKKRWADISLVSEPQQPGKEQLRSDEKISTIFSNACLSPKKNPPNKNETTENGNFK
jgi:hypothetical protein